MKMRKKYQREVNRIIHKINKDIREDNLWLGRFEFRQKDAHWFKFDDNSGGIFGVIVRAVDKSTNYYKDYIIEYSGRWGSWHFWEKMNDFITKDTNTWKNGYPVAADYRNVRISDEVMRGEYNWFLSESAFNR